MMRLSQIRDWTAGEMRGSDRTLSAVSTDTRTLSSCPRPPRLAKGSSKPSITLNRPDIASCIPHANTSADPRFSSVPSDPFDRCR